MKTIDPEGLETWKAIQKGDDYGLACFRYAEAWADLMEAAIGSCGVARELTRKPPNYRRNGNEARCGAPV